MTAAQASQTYEVPSKQRTTQAQPSTYVAPVSVVYPLVDEFLTHFYVFSEQPQVQVTKVQPINSWDDEPPVIAAQKQVLGKYRHINKRSALR